MILIPGQFIKIETYSVIMAINNSLEFSKSAALKFNQIDILRGPVDCIFSYMLLSSSGYKKCLKTKQNKMC